MHIGLKINFQRVRYPSWLRIFLCSSRNVSALFSNIDYNRNAFDVKWLYTPISSYLIEPIPLCRNRFLSFTGPLYWEHTNAQKLACKASIFFLSF
jgi:hypothetical protein